ncbi:hypothetical protein BGP_3618 [Beggiatoa sp. PS]|nr:hypothetical protein BGP_3618 [Beggiatoa sp. PS]
MGLNSEITLKARPKDGSTFTGWSGACSGNEVLITVTVAEAQQCTANFALQEPPPPGMYTLTVTTTTSTTGYGTVTGTGIHCGQGEEDCKDNYDAGKTVRLTATPAPHSFFMAWSGDCSGTKTTAKAIMNADMTCTAVFGSDSDIWAQETTEELYETGELNTGEELSEIYPPPLNEERLWELFRLAENALTKVDQHILVTQHWPELFHGIEWYSPMPETFYVKSIKIISGSEIIGDYYVEGNYVRVDVVLVNNDSEDELVPILVYYNENEPPIIETSSQAQDNLRRSTRGWGHRVRRIIRHFRRRWHW